MRITEQIEKTVTKVISEQTPLGEDPADHEVFMSLVASPQGPAPMVMIMLSIKGLGLGDRIGTQAPLVVGPFVKTPALEKLVRETLQQIYAEKARQIKQAVRPLSTQ